jgi:hypothetical protein
MVRALAVILALLVLVVPASMARPDPLAPQTGPYQGAVIEGQTNAHVYATGPRWCLVPPRYFVTLDHDPDSDVLVLQANGQTAASDDGRAQVAFNGDCSAQFVITVSGAVVSTVATYKVTVTTGLHEDPL